MPVLCVTVVTVQKTRHYVGDDSALMLWKTSSVQLRMCSETFSRSREQSQLPDNLAIVSIHNERAFHRKTGHLSDKPE